MGSLTLTWPMITRIQKKYPNAKLYILSFKKNLELVTLLQLVHPDQLFTIDDSSICSILISATQSLLQMRQCSIDTIVDCELFSRISSILSYFSGAKIRVGFHPHTQEGLYRGNHINRPVLYSPYIHIAHQFISLIEAIDSTTYPENKRIISHGDRLESLRLTIDPDEQALFIDKLQRTFTVNSEEMQLERPLVLLNPGGGLLPIRAWPASYYCETAKALLELGCSVGITGLPEDKEIGKQITDYCKSDHCIDLTGKTHSLHEFIVLLSIAKILITNDGGPGHFAGLTETPAIVLFGPETPTLYGCLNPKGENICSNFACSPCLTAYNHRNSPCDGDNLCLKTIKPSKVLVSALKYLDKTLITSK